MPKGKVRAHRNWGTQSLRREVRYPRSDRDLNQCVCEFWLPADTGPWNPPPKCSVGVRRSGQRPRWRSSSFFRRALIGADGEVRFDPDSMAAVLCHCGSLAFVAFGAWRLFALREARCAHEVIEQGRMSACGSSRTRAMSPFSAAVRRW